MRKQPPTQKASTTAARKVPNKLGKMAFMFIYIEGMKAISEQKWSQEMHVKTRKCTY